MLARHLEPFTEAGLGVGAGFAGLADLAGLAGLAGLADLADLAPGLVLFRHLEPLCEATIEHVVYIFR